MREEVKKYTWTYKDGKHPYLHSSKLNMYFHEFVLGFIYGADNIDKMQEEAESLSFPAFVLDVYYLHTIKQFQLQLYMNDDLFFNKETARIAEMFICRYNQFDDLFLDWFYLLKCRENRKFDITKLHASIIYAKDSPYFEVSEEEKNSPFIIRDGI